MIWILPYTHNCEPVLKRSLVLFPVFARRKAHTSLEHPGKVAGRRKTKIRTDGRDGLIRIAEEAFGFLRFFVEDKICQAFAGFLFEFPGEIGGIHLDKDTTPFPR